MCKIVLQPIDSGELRILTGSSIIDYNTTGCRTPYLIFFETNIVDIISVGINSQVIERIFTGKTSAAEGQDNRNNKEYEYMFHDDTSLPYV